MGAEDATTFFGWLRQNARDTTATGDLARDAIADPTFPRAVDSLDAVREYLHSMRACDAAITAAERAWRDYTGGVT